MTQDITLVRQNVAANTVIYATQLVDALYNLQKLSDQRGKFESSFQDSDFSNAANLKHLTASIVGTFFDFVLPSLQANYADSGNGGRNEQILLQMRQG